MKMGYDGENFRKYSVGWMMMDDLLAHCFETGLDEFDFLGPVTPERAHYRPRTRDIGVIYIYNRRLLSRLHHLAKFRLAPWAKRVAAWGRSGR
jgi:hypothetical protein